MSGPASTPDIMAIAKGIGGGFPIGACLATERGGQGHDGRHARHDLRRQSAGDGGRQRGARRGAGARLPRRACSETGLLLKQRLAELKDRHPEVIAEVRGKGLLLGLQARVRRTASWSPRCAPRSCSPSPPATTSCACCRR